MHARRQARLILVSKAAAQLNCPLPNPVLDNWRAANRQLRVCGLLLHAENAFLQCLEGDHAAITELYVHICQDPRNTRVRMVLIEPLDRPWFQGMDLAYLRVAGEQLEVGRLQHIDATSARRLIETHRQSMQWEPDSEVA